MNSKRFTCIIFFSLSGLLLVAQQADPYVKMIFGTTRLINQQTVEPVSKGAFDLNIQHRFGQANLKNNLLKNFFGMDLTSNIRFGFSFPLTRNLSVGIGRTKFDKNYDFDVKFIFLKQTKDNRIPVSMGFYHNTAYMSDDFPELPENYYFSDSATVFQYYNSHRLSYNTQLIISRKINNSISVQVTPAVVYRNLVPPGEDNLTFALPMGARVKTGLFSSLLMEYAVIANKPEEFVNLYSIAYEIGTAGHHFQITIGNTSSILDQMIYSNGGIDITEGRFYLGFNILRTFWINK